MKRQTVFNLFWGSYFVAIAAIIGLAVHACDAEAAELTGVVTRIVDGDTIDVMVGGEKHRIRLANIDAPEKKQPYGLASMAALQRRIAGEEVTIVYEKRGRYGRIIGTVLLAEADQNFLQVANGHAWHYMEYAHKQQPREDFLLYARAETQARKQRIGIWNDAMPMPPWMWRKQ